MNLLNLFLATKKHASSCCCWVSPGPWAVLGLLPALLWSRVKWGCGVVMPECWAGKGTLVFRWVLKMHWESWCQADLEPAYKKGQQSPSLLGAVLLARQGEVFLSSQIWWDIHSAAFRAGLPWYKGDMDLNLVHQKAVMIRKWSICCTRRGWELELLSLEEADEGPYQHPNTWWKGE